MCINNTETDDLIQAKKKKNRKLDTRTYHYNRINLQQISIGLAIS